MMRAKMAFVCAPVSAFFGSIGVSRAISPAVRARGLSVRRVPHASIEQEVTQKMKEAMKAKDAEALKALRGIRAAFLNALKESGAADTLPDDVAVAQLRKLAKMRKESITMYRDGGRSDLADAEQKELDVIEKWLPSLADEAQTTEWAKEAIEKTGASKKGEMGKVMGYVMKEHKQEVDGSLLKNVVSKMLA